MSVSANRARQRRTMERTHGREGDRGRERRWKRTICGWYTYAHSDLSGRGKADKAEVEERRISFEHIFKH